MSEKAPALLMKEVTKSFSAHGRKILALDGVDVAAEKGVITGLVGPDGAGKTTLMRLCAGLLKADNGKITVLDTDVGTDPLKVQAMIGYMPQQFGLYEDLSVHENLELYADLQGIGKDSRRKKYDELMQMTRLDRFMDRLAGRLSGGMKQKLGLACTLIRSPSFLILDEPTVGVDPVSRRELWAIVSRLVREENMSVFLSTTYLDEAERCQKVVVLHEGRVLAISGPDEIAGQMEGKTFRVKMSGQGRRKTQRLLSQSDSVLDAVITGEDIRLVMKSKGEPDLKSVSENLGDIRIEPVSPRFEDGYVFMLSGEEKKTADAERGSSLTSNLAEDRQDDEAVIRVDHVGKKFGDFYAVQDVSFEVGRGEVFGLLGANGAGKTTTFRMICGLLPATEGGLYVAGHDLRKAAATARGRIGYMSQKFSLYGQLSVLQNLDFFSSAYNLRGKRKRDRIEWALERFKLKPIARTTSANLPLGFKQRLALACCLMHEPEILFLDEPTSGVDPMARREFWFRINRLAENRVTVMVTTHFMEEAEYCDRIALMMAGKILAMGSPSRIKQEAAKSGEKDIVTMEDAFIALIEDRE